jgi:hypothetical protein
LISRGVFAEDLIHSNLWLCGPVFLSSPDVVVNPDCSIGIFPGENLALVHVLVSDVLCIVKLSSLAKAIRVMAIVLRVCHNLRFPVSRRKKGCLSIEELELPKQKLLAYTQYLSYSTEIERLKKRRPIPRESQLVKLDPYIDGDGLLRVRGRLQMSDLCYEDKHPIILPCVNLVKLLVRFMHVHLKHAGVDSMITSLRICVVLNYWIIGVGKLAKRVKRKCVLC